MTEKRFDEKAVAPLLGDCRLEDDPLYRWDRTGEAPGIYLGDIEEIERHFLPSEIMEMTGGLASRSRDSRFPLLAFPCTLAEFVAFEDRACVFRAHLEAGDETADLLREIAAKNPDAGILTCALMPGERPDDEEKLILLPLEKPAPAAPPEAVLMPSPAAPTVAESAPNLDQCLPTTQVATVFDGLPFTAENWIKRLSDTKWLRPTKRSAGEQGGASAMWCPLALAMAIHGREKGAKEKTATLKKLNSLFNQNELLAPHRDKWGEFFELMRND